MSVAPPVVTPVIAPPAVTATPADAGAPFSGMYDGGTSAPTPAQLEFCKRRADLPIIGPLGAEHWWLRHGDVEGGMGPAGGGVPGHGGIDLPFITPTTINDHHGEGNRADATCVPAAQVDPRWANEDLDCIDRQLAPGRDTGTWKPWNQCHTVVEDILELCRIPDADPDAGSIRPEMLDGGAPIGGVP